MTGKDKQNHIFQKSKSYGTSSTVIYIGENWEFIIHIFYWPIPLDGEIYTKCKINICHSVRKTFDFFRNSSVLFYQITFDHSISYVLLINKPNESCQNSKKFKRNAISITKKSFFKKKGNSITPAKTNAPISQTSSEGLRLIIQTYQMRKKELKMKLGQFQDEISKASLPLSADLSNDFQSIILEIDQRKTCPT